MELFSLQYFLFLLFLFLSIYLYLHFFTSPKKYKATGFAVYPIVGTLPSFLKNRHRFLDWTTEILTTSPTNTAVFRRPGKIGGIITANPSNVEHMLKTNFDNYPKGDRFISLIEDFIGRGIFTADGELWKVQRKTASYAFNTKSLRNFVMENVKTEIQSRLIPCLAKAATTRKNLFCDQSFGDQRNFGRPIELLARTFCNFVAKYFVRFRHGLRLQPSNWRQNIFEGRPNYFDAVQ